LDIWIKKNNENSVQILEVLKEFGFASLDLLPQDFQKTGNVIQLGYPPLRIEIINDIDGVNFNECFEKREIFIIDNLEVPFISSADLKKNKKASGRHKDLEDLENLNSK
jgi:hypothetical protein